MMLIQEKIATDQWRCLSMWLALAQSLANTIKNNHEKAKTSNVN